MYPLWKIQRRGFIRPTLVLVEPATLADNFDNFSGAMNR